MLRRSRSLLATHSKGYVFWRQRTQVELEKSKRTYLLNERPIPLAEITRRMIRVRSAYQMTEDFHEKTLLRGEYKYFTGKLCDLRGAALSDLIAFVELCGFFGFWDTSQLDRVIDEIALHMVELNSNELVHLLGALSNVRKHQSTLYREVAREIFLIVDELAFEDCVTLLKACETDDPPPLVEKLLERVREGADRLEVADAVDVLATTACTSPAVQFRFEGVVQTLKTVIVQNLSELSLLRVAQAVESLVALDTLDRQSKESLQQEFLHRLDSSDTRSIAVMFYACGSLSFARAMEERVMFLAPHFTSTELYAVMNVYFNALATVESIEAPSAGGDDGGEEGTLVSKLAVQLTPDERLAVRKRKSDICGVLNELMGELKNHLGSAGTYIPPYVLLGYLQALGSCAAHTESLPLFRSIAHSVCGRVVGGMQGFTTEQLFDVLCALNVLGTASLNNAVAAVIDALRVSLTRTYSEQCRAGLTTMYSFDASSLYAQLKAMDNLSAPQRMKVEGELMPLLRRMVAQDDSETVQ